MRQDGLRLLAAHALAHGIDIRLELAIDLERADLRHLMDRDGDRAAEKRIGGFDRLDLPFEELECLGRTALRQAGIFHWTNSDIPTKAYIGQHRPSSFIFSR